MEEYYHPTVEKDIKAGVVEGSCKWSKALSATDHYRLTFVYGETSLRFG